MEREKYIYKKLGNLSALDKALAEEIVEHIGEWATINEAAKYLKNHKNTIYERVEEGDVISRRIGNKILIYTRSLIFLLE